MSLSRPATFPLLKLPFLCIECVIKSWDVFDIIFFAFTSKRTRQIVKHLKIPLNGIKIIVREGKSIELGSKRWNIRRTKPQSLFEEHLNLEKDCLVLEVNEIPLYTSRANYALNSYTDENEVTALKMALEFLNEVFNCSVETVEIDGDTLPESGNIGVKSAVNLYINGNNSQPFGYAQSQKLSLLLENLEVTGTCFFYVTDTEMSFFCDPKLFKCKQLEFWDGSTAWVTSEILVQFEVPQLSFYYCPFSVEDIISFVTRWFRSDNKKLEYFHIESCGQISLERFQTEDLNALPFSGRNRIPLTESLREFDFSKGLEIVRSDGLEATIHVTGRDFMFYIWHSQ
ncbi:unnamed protein product [Caenorhabditis brenneri]